MAYYGKYRAQVVDNNDPEKRGRIRVKCPTVLGEQISRWALPCFPPNTFTVPQVGELVWIEFEGGKKDSPIWNGVFYSKEQLSNKFKGLPYNPKDVINVAENINTIADKNHSIKAVGISEEAGNDIREVAGGKIEESAGGIITTSAPGLYTITAGTTTMSGDLVVAGQATDADGTMHSH